MLTTRREQREPAPLLQDLGLGRAYSERAVRRCGLAPEPAIADALSSGDLVSYVYETAAGPRRRVYQRDLEKWFESRRATPSAHAASRVEEIVAERGG